MCHVHEGATHPDVDSFQLAGKTGIFTITPPPVPAFMSDYSLLTALFLFFLSLARVWTNQMFLGYEGGELYDEWVRGKVRLRVGTQQESLCIFSLCACAQLHLLDILDVT